jgi:hypothetical protein
VDPRPVLAPLAAGAPGCASDGVASRAGASGSPAVCAVVAGGFVELPEHAAIPSIAATMPARIMPPVVTRRPTVAAPRARPRGTQPGP